MRTIKHIVDAANLAQAIDATSSFTIITGTLNPDPTTNTSNVTADAKVTRVNLLLDFALATNGVGTGFNTLTSNNVARLNWFVMFNINFAQTAPTPGLTGNSVLRNQLLAEGSFNFVPGEVDAVAGPVAGTYIIDRPLNHHVDLELNLPSTWDTFKQGDRLVLYYRYDWAGGGQNYGNSRIKAIYKEMQP